MGRLAGTIARITTTLLACGLGATAAAADFPSRPITLVVPYSPGGLADIVARRIAPRVTERHKVPVVFDYKPGAGGAIGTRVVVNAPPDGYTLLVHTTAITTEPALKRETSYNMLTDLAAVSKLTVLPNVVLVHAAVKANNLAELIAFAKANPGKLNIASGGSGTSTHFAAELFMSMAGIQMVHVAYKGGAPSWQAIMAGEAQVLMDPINNAKRMVDTGKVRGLALSASRRSEYWPDLPTAAEAGLPGFETYIWYGLFAPGRTPPDIVRQVHAVFTQALGDSDIRAWFVQQGFTVIGDTPAEFARSNAAEIKRWTDLARTNRITAD